MDRKETWWADKNKKHIMTVLIKCLYGTSIPYEIRKLLKTWVPFGSNDSHFMIMLCELKSFLMNDNIILKLIWKDRAGKRDDTQIKCHNIHQRLSWQLVVKKKSKHTYSHTDPHKTKCLNNNNNVNNKESHLYSIKLK